tara:strand:+ start:1666 stop:2418 length:753 start_codon:yes stop_codon:yes gene_type:complete
MKIILVTGVVRGIGKKICEHFKKNNWIVIGTDKEDLSENQFDLEFVDLYICRDISNKNAPKEIIEIINNKYNKLDCIINNAACQICKPIWEMSTDEWDSVYNCNVRSVFLFAKYGLKLLREHKGNILNISSVHSQVTSNNIAAYSSSKAAISGLTRNLAIELGKFGIRVNSICPGAIDTQMLRDGLVREHSEKGNIDNLLDDLSKNHILGCIGNVNDIAEFAYFVCNNGKFINGANLMIDGGASIKLSTE